MAQAQLPKLGQESIHETFRILVPGYFALFLVFTLYPELFEGGKGIALALVGGIGLGIILYGMNLHDLFPHFRRMLRMYEKNKLRLMLTIVSHLGSKKAKDEIKNLEKSYDFLYYLWNNFSYSEIPGAVRARQRIHASLFYLYADCTVISLLYLFFVIMAVLLPYHFTEIAMYHVNLRYDLLRILLSLVFIIFFWRKARDELRGSIMFQETAMYYHHKKLYNSLKGVLKLYDEVEERKE